MIRPVKNFDLSENVQEQAQVQSQSNRKPLIQVEPSYYYEDQEALKNHSSIPQGVELQRRVVEEENNVELSDFERKLQNIGIIPSDSWIAGKSKNLWVNLARNIFTETLGFKPEEEINDEDYIIELPQDNLAKVDNLEPQYNIPRSISKTCDASQTTVVDVNYDLFYSEIDESELDDAPSVCEIFK